MTDLTREQIIAQATAIHDEQRCGCDRRYLMSCQRLAAAILGLASPPTAPTLDVEAR